MKNNKALAIAIITFMLVVFVFISFKTGFLTDMSNTINKLNGNVSIEKGKNKPQIISIINSSGGGEVNEDVVLFVDVKDTSKIKRVEYSFDGKSWKKANNITTSNNIATAKVIFTKNMNKKIFIRAINEYNNISNYKSTKVIIKK